MLWEYAEQSFHDPVDMNKWDWKMGAREFLKDRFGEVPEQVPELYTPAYQVPA